MKKHLFFLFTALGIAISAQQPAIGTTTILPQTPSPTAQVKIVTKVTTPSEGVLVDKTFTVTQNPKEINLRICYGFGMLPVVSTYVDTFTVGQLQAGNYAIKFKAYMSSANQHCQKIDSNEVVSTLTIAAPPTATYTGFKDLDSEKFFVYPNPVKDRLYFENTGDYTEALIYQLEGWLVDAVTIGQRGEINVESLSKGLYFVKLSNGDRSKMIKFIKE